MFAVTSLRSAARHCCRVSTAAAARNIQPRGTLLASTQSRFASTLVLSDPLTADGETPAATLSAVTAATQLNDSSEPIELLVVGTVAPTKIPAGISKVYHAKTSQQDTTAETIASTLHSTVTAGSYDYVVGTSTKFGATVIPRAAALLGASPITDIIQVISPDTFVRPMYAGNVLCKVRATKDAQKVLSFRPTSFDKAALEDAAAAAVESIDAVIFENTAWDSENVSKSDRPDLGSASIVVSGGRGMKSGDNFPIIEALADKLGGAVGASRAAVDAGFVPNDMQVGQTGKVVAPDLYIAVGISGAIQHLSGMKDSKTIVAINKDPEAPIFQVADYGLVDDLFTAVPELTEKV